MKAPFMAQAAGQDPARHRRDSSPNLRIHLRGGRADASPTVRWNALLGFKTVDLRPSYRQMRLHRKRQAVPTHVLADMRNRRILDRPPAVSGTRSLEIGRAHV